MSFDPSNALYVEDLQTVLKENDCERLFNKRFLVTGATGLIGSCMIDALLLLNRKGANIQIYAVGRNRETALRRFQNVCQDAKFEFLEQDVRDPFPEDLKVDYILPLASNTHPLAYSQFPIETIFINVDGARNALDLACISGATVVYPSSVEIYGNSRDGKAFSEGDTGELNLSNARSCYNESKRTCEALCHSYISEKGVDARIIRFSRVFGPTMLPNDSKASSQFIKKALASENIVLKSSGEQLFSYTYVLDAVSAIFSVILNGAQGETYNVASKSFNVHLKDFAAICAEYAGTIVVYEGANEMERKGYSIAANAIMNGDKLQSLGWKPMHSFKNSVYKTLNIIRNESNMDSTLIE